MRTPVTDSRKDSLGYSFLDNFSVGYNVGIANYFKYDIIPEDDVYTSEGSDLDTGAGRIDALSAGFSFTCNVAGLLEDVVELPTSERDLGRVSQPSGSDPQTTRGSSGQSYLIISVIGRRIITARSVSR